MTTLDSPGLEVLGQARKRLLDHQGSVVLVAAGGPVLTTLQRAGLPEPFVVVERVSEAIAVLAGRRNQP